jgi:hypothetical protein
MRQVSRKKMSVEGGISVKKIVLLVTAALVAMLILVPTAIAQESTLPASGGQTLPASGGQTLPASGGQTLPASGGQTSDPLPASGGLTAPSALLPAAALIMGSGIVAYAIVRRR